jgi:hypothetical protein
MVHWREEIGLTYGCPDFACGTEDRILIIELKTERGSYRARQASDYLRLARRLHPAAPIDFILLAGHRPRASPICDGQQRYAEMTWAQLPELLQVAVPDSPLAPQLAAFIASSLNPAPDLHEMTSPSDQPPPSALLDDLIATAADQALHIAPALQANPTDNSAERGIDVRFASNRDARAAEARIRGALTAAGYTSVTTWLWQRSSGGTPTTPAGRETGIELRLAPKRR